MAQLACIALVAGALGCEAGSSGAGSGSSTSQGDAPTTQATAGGAMHDSTSSGASSSTSTSGASSATQAGTADGDTTDGDSSDGDSSGTTGPGLPPGSVGVGTDEEPPGFVWIVINGEPEVALLKFDAALELLATYPFEVFPRGPSTFGGGHLSVAASGDALLTTQSFLPRAPSRVMVVDGDGSKCADTNGKPGVQTSTGRALADGDDECVRWQRDDLGKVQTSYWTRGVWDESEETFVDTEVWAIDTDATPDTVYLLDAETGDTVASTELSSSNVLGRGSAVDRNGDLWGMRGSSLVRVSHDTLAESSWETPFTFFLAGENLSFDGDGYVYFARSAYRFVPDLGTFEALPAVSGDAIGAGYAHDDDGTHLVPLLTGYAERLSADLSSVTEAVQVYPGTFSHSTGFGLLDEGHVVFAQGFGVQVCDLADETCIVGSLPPVPPGSIYNGSMMDVTGYANWAAGPR